MGPQPFAAGSRNTALSASLGAALLTRTGTRAPTRSVSPANLESPINSSSAGRPASTRRRLRRPRCSNSSGGRLLRSGRRSRSPFRHPLRSRLSTRPPRAQRRSTRSTCAIAAPARPIRSSARRPTTSNCRPRRVSSSSARFSRSRRRRRLRASSVGRKVGRTSCATSRSSCSTDRTLYPSTSGRRRRGHASRTSGQRPGRPPSVRTTSLGSCSGSSGAVPGSRASSG